MSRATPTPAVTPSLLARAVKGRCRRAWLVGGWVRDRLLGRKTGDADLVVEGDASKAASAAAKRLGGSLVAMGRRRQTFRVVVSGLNLDFASLRAPTILEDLLERDFTINAVALPCQRIASPRWRQHLLDPTNGLHDLNRRVLRAVRPETFDHDPLRMLRAVRLAAVLGFAIERATQRAIARRSHLLSRVAAERVRDELLLILRADRADRYLRIARRLGLLRALMSELTDLAAIEQGKFHAKDALEHSLLTLRHVNRFIKSPGSLAAGLGDRVRALLLHPVAGGRTRGDVLRLAALTHDLGKSNTRTEDETGVHFYGHPALGAQMAAAVARRLRLGKREQGAVRALVENHMRPLLLSRGEPTERSIRRLLVAAGEQTVPLALLAQADLLASAATPATRRAQSKVTARLISAFFRSPPPAPLVDGFQVMRRYGLQPGRQVGFLLETARRAQIERGLRTQEGIWRILDRVAGK